MDPLTIAVAGFMVLLTVGAAFIFVRQELRIKALEERVDKLSQEHIACETDRARLEAKVEHLESELAKLKAA